MVYEVPLFLPLQKTRSFIIRFCAYNMLRYQVSVYMTIGSLVFHLWNHWYLDNKYCLGLALSVTLDHRVFIAPGWGQRSKFKTSV